MIATARVTFQLPPGSVHQVAIYRPGTEPGDIDTTITTAAGRGCPPVPLINDPTNRLAVLSSQPCAGGLTTVSHQFTNSGRHLVICRFILHFVNVQMYGWVNVRSEREKRPRGFVSMTANETRGRCIQTAARVSE